MQPGLFISIKVMKIGACFASLGLNKSVLQPGKSRSAYASLILKRSSLI